MVGNIIAAVVFLILAVLLFLGKGDGLLAFLNEEQEGTEHWNVSKICRMLSFAFVALAILQLFQLLLRIFFIPAVSASNIIVLVATAVIAALFFIICYFSPQYHSK